jgi:hypothetical protein
MLSQTTATTLTAKVHITKAKFEALTISKRDRDETQTNHSFKNNLAECYPIVFSTQKIEEVGCCVQIPKHQT